MFNQLTTTLDGGTQRYSPEIHRVLEQLSSAPVVLYMKGTPAFPQCGFSEQVVAALRACNAAFAYVNVLDDIEARQAVKLLTGFPTFPQLYVNGELLGDADIAIQLYRSGELKQLLVNADAVHPREARGVAVGF
jgi:monothiol glutaredoxin